MERDSSENYYRHPGAPGWALVKTAEILYKSIGLLLKESTRLVSKFHPLR